jgi:hypothetical protein
MRLHHGKKKSEVDAAGRANGDREDPGEDE